MQDMQTPKRGRPSLLEVNERVMNIKRMKEEQLMEARKAKIDLKMSKPWILDSVGKGSSTRSSTMQTPSKFHFSHQEPPSRGDYALSDALIRISIRILWLLHAEKEKKTIVETKDIFGRASLYLDIGTTKLRDM